MEEVCVSLDKNGKRQQLSQAENSQQRHRNEILVDATGCIAGRMCSHVSKLLLKGNRVTIVNSEKAMLSGNRYKTIDLYKEFLEINSVTNPIHGPFHPRRPDTILTKMVRGMVPKTKTSGIEAFKRLRVYIGIPDQFMNKKAESFEDSKITRPPAKYISVGDVAKQIGWKGVLRKEVGQQPQIQKDETKTKGGQKRQKSIGPPQEVHTDKDKKREDNE
jgi:large subunit ribosomal protein L13